MAAIVACRDGADCCSMITHLIPFRFHRHRDFENLSSDLNLQANVLSPGTLTERFARNPCFHPPILDLAPLFVGPMPLDHDTVHPWRLELLPSLFPKPWRSQFRRVVGTVWVTPAREVFGPGVHRQ